MKHVLGHIDIVWRWSYCKGLVLTSLRGADPSIWLCDTQIQLAISRLTPLFEASAKLRTGSP